MATTASAQVKVEAGAFGAFGTGAGQLADAPAPGALDLSINHAGTGGANAGDVYVVDTGNSRIEQFSPTTTGGSFVRTWGWDVVSSGQDNTGANEQQTVTVRATGGTFTLTVTTASGHGVVTNGSNVVTGAEATLGAFHVGDAFSPNVPANTTITEVNEGQHKLTLSANATASGNRKNLAGKETTAAIAATASASQVQAALEALPGIGAGAVTVTGGPGDATGTSPYVITFSAGLLAHNDLAPITSTANALTGGTGEGANLAPQIATIVPGGGYEVCQAGTSPTDVCKPGTATTAAGGLSATASGVTVDQSNGNVYVADQNNRRVAVYDATGKFQGTFGYDMIPGGATGTATVTPGKTNAQITAVTTTSKAFAVGQAITGTGIAPGTTITAVGAGTITLSNPPAAAATGAGTAISSPAGPGNVAINEQQTVTLGGNTTGGTFTLTFTTPNPSNTTGTTAAIVFNAPATGAGSVQAALEGLSNIGAGNVAVSGPNGGPWTIEFKGTRFADTNVTQMTANATGLTVGSGTKEATVLTLQEGAGLEFCTITTGCQIGSLGAAAGQFNTAVKRIAVNPANGHILVASTTSARVDEFTPTLNGSQEVTGVSFTRGFGWDVVASGPDNANEMVAVNVSATAGTFRLTLGAQTTSDLAFNASASTVQTALEALPNIGAGNVSVVGGPGSASGSKPYGVTFTGTLAGKSNGVITAANGATPLSGGSAAQVLTVTTMNPGGGVGFEVCRSSDACKAGTTGAGAGQFAAANSLVGLAIDSGGGIYALDEPGSCTATAICRVQKFDPVTLLETDFAPVDLLFTTGSEKASQIAVDFTSGHLLVVKKTASSGLRLYEFDSSGVSNGEVSPPLAGGGLVAADAIAALDSSRVYVLQGAQSRIAILAFAPPPEDATLVNVTDVTPTQATFDGKFTIPAPGGPGYETRYRFEYSSNGTKWIPVPFEKDINAGNVAGVHEVELTATELDPSTEYLVRLRACTSSCVTSALPSEFTTPPLAPTIALTFSEEISQTEATLGAQINPRHLETTYHFEWGETSSYGHRVPAFERHIGSGSTATLVQDTITGLQPGTLYYFRVVATNSAGTTTGPPQRFETLNDCNLTQGRCFELVSPPNKGPTGEAGQPVGLEQELLSQPSPDGNRMAYILGYGLLDSTNGGEVVYQANRAPGGWSSAQLSPPTDEQSVLVGKLNISSNYKFLSKDLSCGFLVSSLRLTSDAAAMPVIENGGVNLYRHNPDGSYTLVSNLAPTNPAAGPSEPFISSYRAIDASEDCSRVVFISNYVYPGVGFSGGADTEGGGIYEWDNGQLRSPAVVPTSSSSVLAAGAKLGAGGNSNRNAISTDGTRIFFTAVSQKGEDSGKTAVFVRKDGAATVDVSQSQTATPNNGQSRYQMASEDGAFVFFTARYDLAANGTSTGLSICSNDGAGCDLYRYEIATSTLTDLSADSNLADSAGASVLGVLSASPDGSHVYFAARGQVVPGQGSTYLENLAGAGAYNVYLWHGGATSFVATLSKADFASGVAGLLVSNPASDQATERWGSRVTPDGEHLLFKSASNVTGYKSGGVKEAYLYSAQTETIDCISCRRDGQPSVGTPDGVSDGTFSGIVGTTPIPVAGTNAAYRAHPPVVMSDDGSRVFFNMSDPLALGARSGAQNVYEWHQGQITLLTSAIPGTNSLFEPRLLGASDDGDSVFFRTKSPLAPQDLDQRQDVYVARVGGGFDPPATPAPACDPLSENSCQGTITSHQGQAGSAASSTFSGAGNETSKPKKAKKHGKSKKHGKGKKGHSAKGIKNGRDANVNGRAAK